MNHINPLKSPNKKVLSFTSYIDVHSISGALILDIFSGEDNDCKKIDCPPQLTISPFFDSLIDEIILNIFRFIVLHSKESEENLFEKYDVLKSCMLTCKQFNRVASDPSLWVPLVTYMRIENFLKSEVPIHKQIRIVHLHAKEFIYPFDPLIARIERAVHKRIANALNWKLKYQYRYSGTTIFRRLFILEGDQFRLFFSRTQGEQGELGGMWNNTAGGVDSIAIPKLKIPTHNDFSGGLTVYIGDQWDQDRKSFLSAWIFEDDKQQPPKYLHYPACARNDLELVYTSGPSQYFTREYSNQTTPIGQPHSYEREKVYEQITKFLEEEVLQPIIKLKEDKASTGD